MEEDQSTRQDTDFVRVGSASPDAISPTVKIEPPIEGEETEQVNPPVRETEEIALLADADRKTIGKYARKMSAKIEKGLNPDGTSNNLEHNQAMPPFDPDKK